MTLTVNTNVSSLNAQRNLNASQASLTTSMQRLSSGLRINSAKDDAAGLSISERFTAQIRGNDQAARNANDGISLSQTAEGDLDQIGNNLQRMRELAVQSANATNSSSDRAAIDNEVQSLIAEIDRVASNSSFNGTKLLDGSFTAKDFQVGANATAADKITINSIGSARTSALGQYTGFNDVAQGAITGASSSSSLTITSVDGSGALTIANVGNNGKSIAAAINNAGVEGLSATVSAAVATGNSTVKTGAAGITAGNVSFTLNGTSLTVGVVQNDTQNIANTMTAINNVSASTGVVATDTGTGGLKLTAADGRNVDLSALTDTDTTGAVMGDLGLGTLLGTVTASTVSATYVRPGGSAVSAVTIAGAGMATKTNLVAATGTAVSATDVLSVDHAQKALATIDAAIGSINTSRASLGSYQNRFESTIASLQTTTENLTASRGRIKDADFAKETSNLSRSQVLQQAGTAMLAQANQSAQGVLSLLR